MKRSWKQYVAAMLALLTVWLCGCVSKGPSVVLRPIEGKEIVRMEAGRSHTPKTNGWFISDQYLVDILQISVE